MLHPSKLRRFYNQNCNRNPKHVLTQKLRRQACMVGGDVLCPRQSVIKKSGADIFSVHILLFPY